MAYIPVPLTKENLRDKIFQNIHRIVEEYKLTSSYVSTQDDTNLVQYPQYTIYIPVVSKESLDFKNTNYKRTFTVQIDMDVKQTQGYRQSALMADALDNGFDTENDTLATANMSYVGGRTLSSEPIDVNGQLIYSRAEEYTFDILL